MTCLGFSTSFLPDKDESGFIIFGHHSRHKEGRHNGQNLRSVSLWKSDMLDGVNKWLLEWSGQSLLGTALIEHHVCESGDTHVLYTTTYLVPIGKCTKTIRSLHGKHCMYELRAFQCLPTVANIQIEAAITICP